MREQDVAEGGRSHRVQANAADCSQRPRSLTRADGARITIVKKIINTVQSGRPLLRAPLQRQHGEHHV
ncbi:MAG: hypothetical protein JWQ20_1911 [Conexibacter sp.]|nr:hypothetical protein [Conexibacter sp.]